MSRNRSNPPSSVVEVEVLARRDQRPLPAPLPHTADRGGCLAPARCSRILSSRRPAPLGTLTRRGNGTAKTRSQSPFL